MKKGPIKGKVNMAVGEEVEYKISAIGMAERGKVRIPTNFLVDEVKSISMEEFQRDFANAKFQPILIAEGIELSVFGDLPEELFVGLKVDFEDGNIYIIDFSSVEHSIYAFEIASLWKNVFSLNFGKRPRKFLFGSAPRINGMEPDSCIFVTPEFCIDKRFHELPFFVVEVAWSESSPHLEHKIQRWFDLGVLYVLGAKRHFFRKKVSMFLRQKDEPASIWEKELETDRDYDFDITISKAYLFKFFSLEEYDVQPDLKDLHLPVELITL